VEYIWFDYEGDQSPVGGQPYGNSSPTNMRHNSVMSPGDPDSFDKIKLWHKNKNNSNNSTVTYEQSLLHPLKRNQDPDANNNNPGEQFPSSSASAAPARKKRVRQSDMGQEILEGYLVTAGLDQRIFMWNIYGKCVGEFGTFGWDINNESTWNLKKYNPYDTSSNNAALTHNSSSSVSQQHRKNQSKKQSGGVDSMSSVMNNLSSLMEEYPGITNPHDLFILKKYKPKRSEILARLNDTSTQKSLSLHPNNKKKYDFSPRNITKESLLMKDSSSSNLLPTYVAVDNNIPIPVDNSGSLSTNVVSSNGIPMKEMHTYVERLTKKIVHRPPSYEKVNTEFQTTMVSGVKSFIFIINFLIFYLNIFRKNIQFYQ
jgi:hypothetical protein